MHSDINYVVDRGLFGSSKMRTQPLNNSNSRTQIIFTDDSEGLLERVHELLASVNIDVPDDRNTIVNMTGSCVIKFKSSTDADDAMKILTEKISKLSSTLSISWYEPKDDRNVYVKNLPINYEEHQLREMFAKYGSIISTKIIRKENNNNCIAFVRYQTKTEAEKAINEINHRNVNLLGSERLVHCELSKMYGATSNNYVVPQNVAAQHHSPMNHVYYPPNNQYIPSVSTPHNDAQNLQSVPVFPLQLLCPLPQQVTQQDNAQPQFIILPFNPYYGYTAPNG